jgi:hypothetical protein
VARKWLRQKLGLMILVLVGVGLILMFHRGVIRGEVLSLGGVGSAIVVESLSLCAGGSLGVLMALLFRCWVSSALHHPISLFSPGMMATFIQVTVLLSEFLVIAYQTSLINSTGPIVPSTAM